MSQEQFNREKDYQAALSIAKGLLLAGIITDKEYRHIDTILRKKHRPILGSLV